MSLSGSLGAIPATAVFRRRFTSVIGENLLVLLVKAYANAALVRGQQCERMMLVRQPETAKPDAFFCNRKSGCRKRCKIPAVDDFARANFLTSILPLDILRGSCRA